MDHAITQAVQQYRQKAAIKSSPPVQYKHLYTPGYMNAVHWQQYCWFCNEHMKVVC